MAAEKRNQKTKSGWILTAIVSRVIVSENLKEDNNAIVWSLMLWKTEF